MGTSCDLADTPGGRRSRRGATARRATGRRTRADLRTGAVCRAAHAAAAFTWLRRRRAGGVSSLEEAEDVISGRRAQPLPSVLLR